MYKSSLFTVFFDITEGMKQYYKEVTLPYFNRLYARPTCIVSPSFLMVLINNNSPLENETIAVPA